MVIRMNGVHLKPVWVSDFLEIRTRRWTDTDEGPDEVVQGICEDHIKDWSLFFSCSLNVHYYSLNEGSVILYWTWDNHLSMLTNDTLRGAELGKLIYCASIKNWRKDSYWWLGSISGVSGEWRYNWIHRPASVRRLLSFAIQLLIPGIDVIIPQPTFIHSSSWKRYSSSPDTHPRNQMRTGWVEMWLKLE